MVRPGSPGIRLLENLPQRPPTPPRESDHSKSQTEGSVLRKVLSDTLGGQIPLNNSPEPLNGSSIATSNKSRKRVGWSAWTEYEEPSVKHSLPHDNLRPLPPSGELKPTKSILKPYHGINSVDQRSGSSKLAAPHTYPNFATMLESIVKQLAGEDRSSRIDAYLTLSGVLKASDNVPDPRALKEKIGLLTQFIQRDMSAKTASGTLDTVIINNALILLAFFVWNPPIADCLSNEFCTFVVEHAISALKDALVSKDIVKHLLFILGRQNFSSKIMNGERVRRLIEVLVDVEEHVKGRSIILGRVSIYRKLLRQARTSMLASVSWVENLFTDMTSNSREVRAPAVAFGFEAALLLGSEKQVCRAVMELFRRDFGEIKYAHSYSKRLGLMVQNKQDGDLVPQIWSIVVLFLRYRTHQLEHWEFMMPWMHVIEKCFNSSDHDIKTQANLAWNRLVFAIQPDETTLPTMIKFLGKVLDLQLKRKLVGRHAKEARQVAISSVCNLLYYSLNPNATSNQLDMYWDEYVVQLIGKTLVAREQVNSETEEEDLAHACDILGALLDNTPKAWISNRATETAVVRADELPSLDPKWIRKNAQRIFKVLGPLIEKFFKDLIKWETSVELLWSRFVASVGAAGAKEVKVSNDTMSSVACIFTLFYKLWEAGLKDPGDENGAYPTFQKIFTVMVATTTSNLGVLPFTERLLAMGPQEDFAIVATPSHHPHKPRGEIKCPLHHLFILLSRPAPSVNCDERYTEMAKMILKPFFDDRKTRRSRVELAKDLCQLLPLSSPSSRASTILWRVLARFAMMAFDLKATSITSSSSNGNLDQPLGSEYRNLVKILEYGILLSPEAPLPDWKEFLIATIGQITADAGQSGLAISVVEPLSRALEDRLSKKEHLPSVAYCTILVSNASYPVDRQALEAAKRRLWGTSTSSTKSTSFDPYSHFYIYVRDCLQQAYNSLAGDVSVDASELVSSVSNLVHGCPRVHTTGLLIGIQEGVATWILDEAIKFGGRKTSMLALSVATLWSNICNAMRNLPHTDSGLLQSLETLICSGFESKHKRTVSAMINSWNSTFGNEPDLEYPPRVMEAIIRLRSIADIRLPTFPDHSVHEAVLNGLTFEEESQEENLPYNLEDYSISRSAISREWNPHLEPSIQLQEARRASPQNDVESPRSGSRKRAFQGTPENSKRKVAKKNLTPNLRHDDSQIQFAAIDSSPLIDAVLDSQLLTERQREVKERQKETGAMFVNISTSPRLRIKSGLDNLKQYSDPPALKQTSPDDPSTPDLSLREKTLYDEYITSSPTPRHGGYRVHMDVDLTDLPSSPPEQSLPMANLRVFVSGNSERVIGPSKSDVWDVASSLPDTFRDDSRTSTDLGPSAQLVEDLTIDGVDHDISLILGLARDDLLTDLRERPSTPVETYGLLAPERQAPRTPNEIFVDALSSPAPPTPDEDIGSDQPDCCEMEGDFKAITTNLKQNDSQTAYSLSEADEDSMLRLITKFDKARSHHNHKYRENGVEGILEPTSLEEEQANFPGSSIDPSPDYPSIGLEPSTGWSAVLQPQEINVMIRKLRSNSMPMINNAITPPEMKAQSSRRGVKPHLQEKDINKRTRRIVSMKKKIVEEQTEVLNKLAVDTSGSTTSIDEICTNSETSSLGVHDNVSLIAESRQETLADINKQRQAVVSHVGSSHESNFPIHHSKSQEGELSGILIHDESIDRNRQRTRKAHEAQDNTNGVVSDLLSNQENDMGETGSGVIGRFEELLASLRAVALTRVEAEKVETLLWDVKGELYAAERRGRVKG